VPDNKNIIKTVVEFLVDKVSLNNAKKGFDDIEDKAKNSDKQLQKNKRSVGDLGDEYDSLGKRASKALGDIGTEYKGLQRLDDDLQKRLRDRNDDFNRLSDNVGLAGDVQSNLGGVQSLLGTAGASGASQAVGVAGEIAVLSEELPRLKASVLGLPDTIRAASTELGTTATKMGALGVASGALVVALQLAQDQFRRSKESATAAINTNEEYFRLVATGSRESNEQLKKDLELELSIQKQIRAENVADLAQFRADLSTNFTEAGRLFIEGGAIAGLGAGEVAAVAQAVDDSNTKVSELEQRLKGLNLALEDTSDSAEGARIAADSALAEDVGKLAEVRRFERDTLNSTTEANRQRLSGLDSENNIILEQVNRLKEQGQGTEDNLQLIQDLTQRYNENQDSMRFLMQTAIPATKAIEEQARAQEIAKEKILEENKANQERASVLGRVNQLQDQANKVIEQFAEREASFERKRSQSLEDFGIKRTQQTEDHNRKLLDISRQGTDRINKLNQSASDLQSDYFKSQVASQREYANELKSVDERRNLDRIQREREGAQELDELAFENNVIAFLRAKRKQDSERQAETENQSLEDQQRARQFSEQRRQEEQAFLQRRELLQRQITEEKQAIQQRIDAERESFGIQQQRQQEAFNLAQKRAQQELDLERQKTQQQLQLIQAKAQAEVNAVSGTTSQVRILQSAVDSLTRSVQGFGNSAQSAGSSSSSSSVFGLTASVLAQREANRAKASSLQTRNSGGTSLRDLNRLGVAFANGGISTRPTLSITGEKRGFNEAMIPFRPSEGIRPALERAGMSTQPSLNLTINATVGENASIPQVKSMINQAVNESKLEITRGVAQGITKARYNASA